ncbi:cobalamin biosynthesis protein [Rhodoligotrophos defluvii]|uniref:cobalamin biosynthesis protein n=1 Tax=Rhodoligotrophos defluvii TaxID=2561934 RepID=UPI0010C93E61|nr:cobalamin biosynthesis protein [Rhodoligotrophos defluvii]
MIIAGLGLKPDCPPADLLVLIEQARLACAEGRIDALAAPAFRRDAPGLAAAAKALALPLLLIDDAALASVQPLCPTRSARALAETGFASIAEAVALSAAGPGAELILPRIAGGAATCALARSAEVASPSASEGI